MLDYAHHFSGKTLDLAWLASQANVREVYGTEGVQTAMEDLRQAPSDIGEAIRYDHGPLLPESASTANINDRHMVNSALEQCARLVCVHATLLAIRAVFSAVHQ